MRDENNQATLTLPAAQARRIAAEAEAGYPDEICGFLVGVASGAVKNVTRLIPIENDWDAAKSAFGAFDERSADFAAGSRRRRFAIPPDEFYRADKAARAAGEDILGFYHSHPDNPAVPSEYDLMLARGTFPGYSYVIVSVAKDGKNGRAAELTSWLLTEDSAAFVEETILADDGNFLVGVDRILWEIWDPIGVNDTPEARDEYVSYAPAVAALLRRDAPDAEFLHFLETAERETMGLRGSNREHLMAVIAHLRRFAEGE